MIQDIEPFQFKNQFEHKKPRKEDYVLYYKNNLALLHKEKDKVEFPTFELLQKDYNDLETKAQYLFSIGDKSFFLILDLDLKENSSLVMENTQVFREMQPQYLAFAGITGSQLYRWYTSNKFCGRCGRLMEKSESERAMVCKGCNNIVYPKISPAVIVGVINGDKILLTKYANRGYSRAALIAGFTEIGETLESTVKREVMEEVGLEVEDLQYYKSQPWSFSDSLLVGYFARLKGNSKITLDYNELAEGQWVPRKDLQKPSSNISLTSEMIEYFRQGKI